MKTTMVHVFDLLGCMANGPTTEAALEATPRRDPRVPALPPAPRRGRRPRRADSRPRSRRTYGGIVDRPGRPGARLRARLRAADSRKMRVAYRRRFQWLGEDIVAAHRRSPGRRAGGEAGEGTRPPRHLFRISRTLSPSTSAPSGIGKPEGVKEALKAIEGAQPGALAARLRRLWQLLDAQLERITPEIRTAQGPARRKAVDGAPRLRGARWSTRGSTSARSQRRLGVDVADVRAARRPEYSPQAHLRAAVGGRRVPCALDALLAARRPEGRGGRVHDEDRAVTRATPRVQARRADLGGLCAALSGGNALRRRQIVPSGDWPRWRRSDRTITLMCICADENRCHRSLLRDLIIEAAG